MSEWFQRQFGDRGEFALCISLGTDPHPSGQVELDLTWGTLEIWARNRCLTASVSDGVVAQGVRWSLLPIFEWFLEVGIRLVNEDPYPRFSKGCDVGDASAWFDATLTPPILSPDAERRWFLRRSEWRHHHALRRSAENVALPNVVFRRLGENIEISWDNESWCSPRPDLYFVEKRGRELVPALAFANVLRAALVEVLAELARKTSNQVLVRLASHAADLRAEDDDWRWLIHRPTAKTICDGMPQLKERLDRTTSVGAKGLYVPHSAETLVLRHVRLEQKRDIEAVLQVAQYLPHAPVVAALQALVRPSPAANERPWEEGNEYAESVRDALGWGDEPLPDLAAWMTSVHIDIPSQDLGLPSSVAVVAKRTDDLRMMVHVNPAGASRMKRETGLATALGHVLLDEVSVSVDGDWEHWPTSARARAFGVALTLPEDGVRAVLGGATSIGADEVRAVMRRYRSGPWATTYRLKNLGLITPDEQIELVQAIA